MNGKRSLDDEVSNKRVNSGAESIPYCQRFMEGYRAGFAGLCYEKNIEDTEQLPLNKFVSLKQQNI